MAEGYVIGVDLGGTKLLAGAVGADLSVIHRTNRPVYGLSQDELVQMVADAVEEIRIAVGGEIQGIGFGIPCTFDSRSGMAVQAVNVPLKDIAFGEVMAEQLQMPVLVDNDANCHTVCESRIGIAQGATDVTLLTLGTGIGGGLLLRGEIYRGWIMGGAEMGHMVVEMNGRPCQGNCPNWGCLESVASGSRARARGVAGGRAAARHRARPRARGRPRAHRPADHRARQRGRPGRPRRDRDDRPRARRRHREPREHLQPAGRRDRRRRDRGRRAAARARARGDARARARRPRKDVVRVEAARFGPEAGMIGAGLLARDLVAGVPTGAIEAQPVSGRLVVCPTPIGNLEDITLRVLAALRDADVVACEDTRHTKALLDRYGVNAKLVSYHEHNERARAAELVERMRGGEVVALVSDAGHAAGQRPGLRARAGLRRRRAARSRCCPGPSSAITALVASALPTDAWRFAGFLPRKRGPLEAVFAAPETVVAFESPKRVGASLKVLAELDPERPVAVCRELTKLHEEIVRGTRRRARRRATPTSAPRGEIVLVVGGAPERTGADPAAVEAVRKLVEAGARARAAASVVAELTGAARQRALPRRRDVTRTIP